MRILHTSDWHLGIRHGPATRAPDHDAFFEWLRERLRTCEIDALLIAGDIFDTMQPAADTLRRWYRFLAGLGDTGVTQVVVVGGNHDSAARLEAPAEVLGALRVHVVGGVGLSPESRQRCIVPLYDRRGDLGAVCLAVPYVHEFRLGVRTTDLDVAATRRMFRERFSQLYSSLADQAQAAFPGVPLIATGHLTVGSEATREDYPYEIHQVGTLDALPIEVFDARIQYVALGHIHRAYPVGKSHRVWYSGSPIAFSLPEAQTNRRVLQVDLSPDPNGAPGITHHVVPQARSLVELRAAPDELVRAIRDLIWPDALPPLLFCRVVCDLMPPDLPHRLHEALETHPEMRRPVLTELRQERATPIALDDVDAPMPALAELTPTQVFATLCRTQAIAEGDPVFAAFAQLTTASSDDFDAMVDAAQEGLA